MMISPNAGRKGGRADGRLNRSRLALLTAVLVLIALTISEGLLAPPQAEALDGEEQTFLHQINDYRAQHGLGQLSLNDSLDDVARWMANDLATNNYFSHVDSLGRDPFQRTDGLGYNTWRGENLAAGTQESAAAFQLWHDSPPHNENMLGPHYTMIGIARAYSMTSDHGWYWVTEFAGEAPPPPLAPAAVPETTPEPAPAPPPPPATVVEAQSATPLAPNHTADQAPAQAVRTIYGARTGLLIEGIPPMDFGPRIRGTFLSALLELAPAFGRSSSRHSVRV